MLTKCNKYLSTFKIINKAWIKYNVAQINSSTFFMVRRVCDPWFMITWYSVINLINLILYVYKKWNLSQNLWC